MINNDNISILWRGRYLNQLKPGNSPKDVKEVDHNYY